MSCVLTPGWNGLHHGMINHVIFTIFMVFLCKRNVVKVIVEENVAGLWEGMIGKAEAKNLWMQLDMWLLLLSEKGQRNFCHW